MVKKKFFHDQRIANIARWWAVAAIYFFVGWGTGLGGQDTIIDLVFFLGLAIGILEMFIINPVLSHMFRIDKPIKLIGRSILFRVSYRVGYILRAMMLVALVAVTYNVINHIAIGLEIVGADQVFLPGEPILFGIFYMIFYLLLTKFIKRVSIKIQEIESKEK